MAGYTIRNLKAKKHVLMPFSGKWRDSFGTPSDSGVWIVYGQSGCGKTSLLLQLTNYLRVLGKKVIYWSIEQCDDYGFQQALCRTHFDTESGIKFFGKENTLKEDILPMMTMKRGYEVLIIDSLTPLNTMQRNPKAEYERLSILLKDKLIIYVSHEESGMPDLSIGRYILTQANIKVRMEGYKAFVNNRAGFGEHEGGGADFIVYEKGANEYWMDKM